MFTFSKSERLSSKKDISLLYTTGQSKPFYPLKVFWREHVFESEYPIRVLITVPKRSFKKAVDRNLLKRRIREVYRLNKHPLYSSLSQAEKKLDLLIMFVGKEKVLLPEIEKALKKALEMLCSLEQKKKPN
ncbi:MAG: ribonuclease P protein component [Bacteroidota bacterium]|nr:ribonuclease P protein component [Bacteroidota bacterium]